MKLDIPRFCFSEVIVTDNKTKQDIILGGGFNTPNIATIIMDLKKCIEILEKSKL